MSDTRNVVEIGELRLARIEQGYLRMREGCQHKLLELDDTGQVVTCRDCKVQVSAYWALSYLVSFWEGHSNKVKRTLAAAQEERGAVLHLTAAKKVEAAWRSKTTVPSCPHCRRGIFPHDNLGGATVARRFEEGLRERERADSIAQGLPMVAKLLPGKPPAKAKRVAPKPRSKVKPRPLWGNAPAWAEWLTGDVKGRWTWHQIEPFEVSAEFQSGSMHAFAGTTLAAADGIGIKEKRPRAEPQP
ncbi:hypothetical protein [Pseudomonas sp. UMAB-40]|uniref:hypothetical protein n=1 Tax=Pseudomonas sp. UMAB-40 TaxID=1365407 RepID=UPI001C58D3B5|nr:hypothetical protein [Pseudomonas sp. UMAB-40]